MPDKVLRILHILHILIDSFNPYTGPAFTESFGPTFLEI